MGARTHVRTGSSRFTITQSMTQIFASDAESTRRCGNVAVCLTQCLGDEFGDHRVKREAAFGHTPRRISPTAGGWRQRVTECGKLQRRPGAKDDFAFDRMGEFADVAAPGLGEETRFGRSR